MEMAVKGNDNEGDNDELMKGMKSDKGNESVEWSWGIKGNGKKIITNEKMLLNMIKRWKGRPKIIVKGTENDDEEW